jgi:peptidoglycan/LPS O-acetylase OafA/YrhL
MAMAAFFRYMGRFFLALAFLALISAWMLQLSGTTLLGVTQEHLFNDAIVLALLGIGLLIDALTQSKSWQ